MAGLCPIMGEVRNRCSKLVIVLCIESNNIVYEAAVYECCRLIDVSERDTSLMQFS